MAQIVNTTESDRVFPDTGERVGVGETYETDPETAALLAEQGWSKSGAKPPTVADVLAQVGDDPVAAAAALADEQARDKPRPSLVDKLAAIAAVEPNNEGA